MVGYKKSGEKDFDKGLYGQDKGSSAGSIPGSNHTGRCQHILARGAKPSASLRAGGPVPAAQGEMLQHCGDMGSPCSAAKTQPCPASSCVNKSTALAKHGHHGKCLGSQIIPRQRPCTPLEHGAMVIKHNNSLPKLG